MTQARDEMQSTAEGFGVVIEATQLVSCPVCNGRPRRKTKTKCRGVVTYHHFICIDCDDTGKVPAFVARMLLEDMPAQA